MKRSLLLLAVAGISSAAGIWLFSSGLIKVREKERIAPELPLGILGENTAEDKTAQNQEEAAPESSLPQSQTKSPSRDAEAAPPITPEQLSEIQITLRVEALHYKINVPEGATVLDAMEKLASSNSLTFKSTYFAGLGYLIDDINGVRSNGGKYWKYYVNNIYAEIGVSQFRPSNGDVVEWRYE